jgi:hypothetical protein
MRNVPLQLSLMLVGLAAVSTALSICLTNYCRSVRNTSETGILEHPFADLDTAIRSERLDEDWMIHQGPGIPGPYRVVGAMHFVGRNLGRNDTMILRKGGSIVATSSIESRDEYDQLGLFVESENGNYDTVVMKRYRVVPIR